MGKKLHHESKWKWKSIEENAIYQRRRHSSQWTLKTLAVWLQSWPLFRVLNLENGICGLFFLLHILYFKCLCDEWKGSFSFWHCCSVIRFKNRSDSFSVDLFILFFLAILYVPDYIILVLNILNSLSISNVHRLLKFKAFTQKKNNEYIYIYNLCPA